MKSNMMRVLSIRIGSIFIRRQNGVFSKIEWRENWQQLQLLAPNGAGSTALSSEGPCRRSSFSHWMQMDGQISASSSSSSPLGRSARSGRRSLQFPPQSALLLPISHRSPSRPPPNRLALPAYPTPRSPPMALLLIASDGAASPPRPLLRRRRLIRGDGVQRREGRPISRPGPSRPGPALISAPPPVALRRFPRRRRRRRRR